LSEDVHGGDSRPSSNPSAPAPSLPKARRGAGTQCGGLRAGVRHPPTGFSTPIAPSPLAGVEAAPPDAPALRTERRELTAVSTQTGAAEPPRRPPTREEGTSAIRAKGETRPDSSGTRWLESEVLSRPWPEVRPADRAVGYDWSRAVGPVLALIGLVLTWMLSLFTPRERLCLTLYFLGLLVGSGWPLARGSWRGVGADGHDQKAPEAAAEGNNQGTSIHPGS
jgi:hypothetical protein